MGLDNYILGRNVQCSHQSQIAFLLNTSQAFRTVLLGLFIRIHEFIYFSVHTVRFFANKYGIWMDGMDEISQLAPITCLFSVIMVYEMVLIHEDAHKFSVWVVPGLHSL